MKAKGNSSAEKLHLKQHNNALQIFAYNREGRSLRLFSMFHNYCSSISHTTSNNIIPTSILFAILLVAIASIACLAATATAASIDNATVTKSNTTTGPAETAVTNAFQNDES